MTSPHRTRLVIVGGVAGGMSCAARARRLDESAQIIVLERGPHVSFANCGLPYFVGGEITDPDALLVQTPDSLAASLNLDVRCGHDVTAVDASARTVTVHTAAGEQTIAYDHLVLSPGAAAIRPAIDGAHSPRVHTLRTVDDALVLRDGVSAGASRAVVLGAGFIGVEAAEALAGAGLHTTLVQRGRHVLTPLEDESAWFVEQELRGLGIDVRDGVEAVAIEHGDDHDTVVLSDGVHLDADLIVLAAGVRPDTDVFARAGVAVQDGAILVDEHGRTNQPGIWAVGDATAGVDAVTGVRRPVALAGPANRAGRLVADAIFRPDRARPITPTTGTAIVRVGSIAAAITGANRAQLEGAGIPHHTLHLHPNQHAGYFPGAETLHLIVHVGSDGALLGAQAVGADGVDKRIDVLATAIRAGLAVDDLIDLDLAYSPPYGQAKDAVNLIGMVGENVRTGTLTLWDAHDLDEVRRRALILDVRREDEVAGGMVPGALHIPHTELRTRMGEVADAAAGRPVRVMCASGVRSAIAHRQLVQAGFDSASLSGGMQTLRSVLGDRAAQVLVAPAPSAHSARAGRADTLVAGTDPSTTTQEAA